MDLKSGSDAEFGRLLEVESEEVYVVYDGKSGAIAHVHRVVNHRGAKPAPRKQMEARALELAGQFGHRGKGFRVLRASDFDPNIAQRVDMKKSALVAARPKTASGKKSARATLGGIRRR